MTDVQESQAAFDQATADEIQAKRELARARFLLREITGEYIQDLAAPGEGVPLKQPDPFNVESWVDQSMAQNLDLIVSRIDEQLARDEISSRRNGHLPTLDLVASVGNRDVVSEQDTGLDVGALPADSNFDRDSIGIEFNLPLFAGGATSSRVREAVYLHRASREALQRVTRETESTTRDSFLAVETDISRVQALRQAVQSSRTALEATEAGFEVGTRTIVQVLDQQFLLYDNIVRYYRARYDYILNTMRLKQASGTLSVQDLEALEPFLRKLRTTQDTRRTIPRGRTGDRRRRRTAGVLRGSCRTAGRGRPRKRVSVRGPANGRPENARKTPASSGRFYWRRPISGRSISSRRDSAPRFASRIRLADSTMRRRASGSPSSSVTASPSSVPSSTMRHAPEPTNRSAISWALKLNGPESIATDTAAGSSRLWPPISTRLPPTNAASAAA